MRFCVVCLTDFSTKLSKKVDFCHKLGSTLVFCSFDTVFACFERQSSESGVKSGSEGCSGKTLGRAIICIIRDFLVVVRIILSMTINIKEKVQERRLRSARPVREL